MRFQRSTLVPRLQIDDVRTIHAVPPDDADDPDLIYRDIVRLLDGADVDPDLFPTETVELPFLFERLLNLTKARATLRVHSVFPCATCQRPITCLHLEGTETWMIVNAVEHPNGSDSGADFWTANLFDVHHCPEVLQ